MRAVVVALLLSLTALIAHAAEWDTIRPGESTQEAVRSQFGQPTRVSSQKIEGYVSAQWLYEGAQTPRGVKRLLVDFGLLTPQGYRANLVRQMLVEPRPGIFTRPMVLAGWGEPDATAVEGEARVMQYRSGLFVYFDRNGWNAERMYFTPPQKLPEESAPRRP